MAKMQCHRRLKRNENKWHHRIIETSAGVAAAGAKWRSMKSGRR